MEAYIASQKAEGWVCLPDRYDDGGFTGGNMERPGFQRLMAAIDGGKIDCVVVYTAAGSRQESCGHCYGWSILDSRALLRGVCRASPA